ncbi:MAG: dephospho-CoA kinase [Burkholderiales bacterium]
MPHRLGLTGGIGSGKTTVAQLLHAHGAAVIDADAIARSVTAAGGAAMAEIAAEFGPQFILADGALNRDHMRAHAFANPPARQRLEAIVHPWVGRLTTQQAVQAADAGHPCLVFDVPLLVESAHWRSRVDTVLVVDCEAATQVARTSARSALTEQAVQQIMAAQASRAQRLAAADHVLYNEGISLDALREQVARLAPRFGLPGAN